MGES
jgi:hypothetical protein